MYPQCVENICQKAFSSVSKDVKVCHIIEIQESALQGKRSPGFPADSIPGLLKQGD